MFIAQQKRKDNIAEYLLYMWQIEDLIRANGCDLDTIKHNVVTAYAFDTQREKELTEWYESLIDMMRREDVVKTGHLQINKNIIILLTDLHLQLLKSDKYPEYGAEFYKTLPFIVELRARTPQDSQTGEIETCFNALYGMLLLRLQHREISSATQTAMQQISHFVGTLAAYFKKDEEEPLFEEKDFD